MKNPYNHGHLIVCAAIKKGDRIDYCVRHSDSSLVGDKEATHGFVDNKRNFLNRVEAYKIANKAGQIRIYPPKCNLQWHKDNGTEPRLFSENLY